MNSFELNKILGAVLFTGLCLLALNIAASAIFSPVKPAKPGYDIAVKEHAGDQKAAVKEPEKPIAVLLASASVEKGQTAAKKCVACHTFEKGGPNKVGPGLWDILGRKVASHAGFDYSARGRVFNVNDSISGNDRTVLVIAIEDWRDHDYDFTDMFFAIEIPRIGEPQFPVPEPSTYGLIGAMLLLGLVAVRRARRS